MLPQLKEVVWKSSDEKLASPAISRFWRSPLSPWSYSPTPAPLLASRSVPAETTTNTGGSPTAANGLWVGNGHKPTPTGFPLQEACTCTFGSLHFLCQSHVRRSAE